MDPVRQQQAAVYESPRFGLYHETWQTEAGLVQRPVIHHPGAVAIIAQPQPHSLLMVRQWRYSLGRYTLEIPAGTRDRGEDAEVTAARELREETGFAAERLTLLATLYPAVGVSDELMYFFRADGLVADPLPPDHGELIGVQVVELTDLASYRQNGMICDAKTYLALEWLGVSMFSGVIR